MKPLWVTLEATLAIHDAQLAEHGGAEGIRDMGALESALARPQNFVAYSMQPPSMGQLTAAYAFGIARNHPFLDGNKRTALVVAETFLDVNGYELTSSNEDTYLIFLSLAEGEVSETELSAWLDRFTVPKKRTPRPSRR